MNLGRINGTREKAQLAPRSADQGLFHSQAHTELKPAHTPGSTDNTKSTRHVNPGCDCADLMGRSTSRNRSWWYRSAATDSPAAGPTRVPRCFSARATADAKYYEEKSKRSQKEHIRELDLEKGSELGGQLRKR